MSSPHFIFFSLLFFFLIQSSNSTLLIKAGNNINYYCNKNIYYISIDVIFSEKTKKETLPFTLNLAAPENLNFKCMIEFPKSKIQCFRAFSDEADFIANITYLQFPYPFPELEDIEWDYETFLQKIYRKVWPAGSNCGNENLLNLNNGKEKIFDIEGELISLENGFCKPASMNNNLKNTYTFDMNLALKQDNLNQNSSIEFLQEIWVPLFPKEETRAKNKLKTYQRKFSFAFCKANNAINKDNYSKFTLKCEVPIETNDIFNGVIKVGSFYDQLYIKQDGKISMISLYVGFKNNNLNDPTQKNYLSLSEQEQGIICPNQPLFTVDNKESITMGFYYSENNKYTFFITGTLSNGYYVFKNGTTVELEQTYKDINFNLKVADNLLDSDENEVITSCTLPMGSPFQLRNKAQIKCIGTKDKKLEQNKNVDITLNWNLKANNNFDNIMISWPKTYDESNKKNIYQYQLTGLSIRQSNYGCHSNNFDFYVYIYNLYREPKISFNLPLTHPRSNSAKCELFDPTALKCSINLKHKKLSKGEQVMLPERGSENELLTPEGNRIKFTMNNFSKINNDHDFYVKLEESCGDTAVVGTLKDMGMSHKSSKILYIFIIIIASIIIVGFILYVAWKIRIRMKRGKKLLSDENKTGDVTVGGKA